MQQYEYEFEELRIIPGVDVLAYGKATLEYEVEPDDAYTGYRGGICWDVIGITLYGSSTKSGDMVLPEDHPVYDLICKALREKEYRINEELEEEVNSDMRDEDY